MLTSRSRTPTNSSSLRTNAPPVLDTRHVSPTVSNRFNPNFNQDIGIFVKGNDANIETPLSNRVLEGENIKIGNLPLIVHAIDESLTTNNHKIFNKLDFTSEDIYWSIKTYGPNFYPDYSELHPNQVLDYEFDSDNKKIMNLTNWIKNDKISPGKIDTVIEGIKMVADEPLSSLNEGFDKERMALFIDLNNIIHEYSTKKRTRRKRTCSKRTCSKRSVCQGNGCPIMGGKKKRKTNRKKKRKTNKK